MRPGETERTVYGDTIIGNSGDQLIEALEHFILPLIRGGKGATGGSSALTPAATNLLVALQNFVVSLTPENPPSRQTLPPINDEYPLLRAPPPRRHPLLKQILIQARDRVFNKMPIRMLVFNSSGTEIRLADRSEILRIISKKIEEEFDHESAYEFNPDSAETSLAVEQYLNKHCAYAILSHTWLRESPGEVTFTDWTTKTFDPHRAGYLKLEMFCRMSALDHGMTLGWMDTCCIDKTSSAELDESIRSMFRWYQSSAVCVTYLADTMILEDMHKDTWFTRGWTLQELLAPQIVKFYNCDWDYTYSNITSQGDDRLNAQILSQIQKATTITKSELRSPLYRSSISRRMEWAAGRHVTKEEDTAYSLMGIFDVSFSTAYGEGSDQAFLRLIREIINGNQHSDTLDIVNWGNGDHLSPRTSRCSSKLIPDSPKYYVHRTGVAWYRPHDPILLTPLGLRVSVLLMPALREKSAQAETFTQKGDYFAIANIQGHFTYDTLWMDTGDERYPHGVYNILDERLFNTDGDLAWPTPTQQTIDNDIQIFGVLNFKELETTIKLPRRRLCFALVLLSHDDTSFYPAQMVSPVKFTIEHFRRPSLTIPIQKKDLHKHGMKLTTMYL